MKAALLFCSVASLLVLGAAAYHENFRGEWRRVQRDYKRLLVQTAGSEGARRSAEAFSIEHKQLFLPQLGAVDRCTTCHLGVENPAMAGADAPLGLHPGDLLAFHPIDSFGCTVCHQGQGRSTTKELAHGWRDDGAAVEHVDAPLLRNDAVYTSCGRCHPEVDLFGGAADLFAAAEGSGGGEAAARIEQEALTRCLPRAERLLAGKRLVGEMGCLGCHKYRGRGGTLGPDLTYVGDKTRHDFDFSRVKGEHTVERWLFEHFKLPQEISPGTEMPDMRLTDQQARDMALYMMALHKKSAPASHMPHPGPLPATAEPAKGETLYQMFCSACHGADGLGTTMRAGLWPLDADPWGHDWDRRNVVTERRNNLDVMVPSLHHPDTLATVSDDYLRRIISLGRPGTKMLAWSSEGGLNDDEIERLIEFLRHWEPPVPDLGAATASRGEPEIGRALYRANCAACHGADGEGGIGVRLNSPTFLAVASDAFLRDTIAYGRPNTAMPAWRDFDAQELSDLLAFIRQWQPQRSEVEPALALCSTGEAPAVSAEIGKTLYKANCVMCHGPDGAGDLGPSVNTQAFLTVVPDSYLVETMISGRPGTAMPSWRHFSNEDVASLVRYLRSWQTGPAKPPEWHAQTVPRGDWDAGRYLFAGHCAPCHGADGEGSAGPQLNNPVFLRTATDVMLREWIAQGKEGTEMRGFRKGGQGITELTDRQIEDVVAYVRSLQRLGPEEIVRVSKSPHGRPERGAVIYANNCVSCHGDRGEGASGPALSNRNFLRFASDGFLMATMALGRSGTEMRPVKSGPQSILGLSSDAVNDLVAYLRSWEYAPPFGVVAGGTRVSMSRDAAPEIPHRFVIPWDLARGKALFASNCAGCHGENGRGSWAPELNNEGFLAGATDGFLQATIVRGRVGTAMRAFGHGSQGLTDLTSDDVDDIVAYIRQWSTIAPSPLTIPAQRSFSKQTNADVLRSGNTASHEGKRARSAGSSSRKARVLGELRPLPLTNDAAAPHGNAKRPSFVKGEGRADSADPRDRAGSSPRLAEHMEND